MLPRNTFSSTALKRMDSGRPSTPSGTASAIGGGTLSQRAPEPPIAGDGNDEPLMPAGGHDFIPFVQQVIDGRLAAQTVTAYCSIMRLLYFYLAANYPMCVSQGTILLSKLDVYIVFFEFPMSRGTMSVHFIRSVRSALRFAALQVGYDFDVTFTARTALAAARAARGRARRAGNRAAR